MAEKIVSLLEIIQVNDHQRTQRILFSVLNGIMDQLLGRALIVDTSQRILLGAQKKLHLLELFVMDINHAPHDTGHIPFRAQKGSQVRLIPCIIVIKTLYAKFNGVMLRRFKQALQNRLVVGDILLINHRGVESLHISAVNLILRHAVLIVRPDNHYVRLGIIINDLLSLSFRQNVQPLRLSLQLFLHILSLSHILDHRYNRIFSSLPGIKISPDMEPAQITASCDSTELRIHHTVILQHIPDGLSVSRQVIRNNTQFHLIQKLHTLYPGITKHSKETFVDINRPHVPILILEEADSRYDIVNHRAKVFNT